MVFCMTRGIHYTVKAMMMQVDMNLSFPVIWEQDKCGSSDPIGIGALDVKLSYFDWRTMHIRRKSSFTRQFRVHNGQIAPWPSRTTISITYGPICKGPWGIERLLDVYYHIWQGINTCYEDFSRCFYVYEGYSTLLKLWGCKSTWTYHFHVYGSKTSVDQVDPSGLKLYMWSSPILTEEPCIWSKTGHLQGSLESIMAK